jgi:hypothetical protein
MRPSALRTRHGLSQSPAMIVRISCLVWMSCAAGAQSPPVPAGTNAGTAAAQRSELLARIRVHAIANLDRLPNYTCRETVDRSHRLSSTHKFQLLDTVRLEVALVDGKEMFGWPGARKFEDMDLRNFVSQGAIGNGNFALHARAVFHGQGVRFEYRAEASNGNQPWVRFAFQVPLARSGYSLRMGENKAVVGYHGSFDTDPKSLDLERIEVIADDIPRELHLTSAEDRVEYARTEIGSGEFLLPSSSELIMVDLDGSENRNQVRFDSCRQFTGESVLTFDDPSPSGLSSTNAPANVGELLLPPDLSLTLALLDEVDLAKAAIGDPVRARLQNDLKSKGRLLLSRNAIASGHITRIEHHSDSLVIGLRFDEIEAPGVRAQPRLRLDQLISADQVPARARVESAVRPGEGIFTLGVGRTRLNRGLLMNWSTQR